MIEKEKTNKFNFTQNIASVLWMLFGVFGGINYYLKAEYWICGIMALISVFNAYNLFKSIKRKSNNTL